MTVDIGWPELLLIVGIIVGVVLLIVQPGPVKRIRPWLLGVMLFAFALLFGRFSKRSPQPTAPTHRPPDDSLDDSHPSTQPGLTDALATSDAIVEAGTTYGPAHGLTADELAERLESAAKNLD